jgi:protein SCO1/2
MGRAARCLLWALAAIYLPALLAGAPAKAARWGNGYVPNLPVVSQDGRVFQFYEDLIKDKIFVISFFYASCTQICPLATARLSELQEVLGDNVGREIFFYTISVDPENDTPERLKKYAQAMRAGPGWLFLTGMPEDIRLIRDRLGDRSTVLNEHRNEVLLGNGVTGEWQRDNPLSDLTRLAMTVRSMQADWRVAPAQLTRQNEQAAAVPAEVQSMHAMFAKACAGCHSIGRGDRVGPDLAGVGERRSLQWLTRFIADPEQVRRQKDPVALALAAKFPAVRMPAMGISETEAANLVAYIEQRQPKRQPPLSLEPLLALTTQDGVRLAANDLSGRALAVAFGYTHCPDVCPTTLLDWSNLLDALGPAASRLKLLFISVDGERDTPNVLKAYLRSFHPDITALTGTPSQIAAAAALFEAYYARIAGPDGAFTYDHSIKVYLIDGTARMAGTLDLNNEPSARLELLTRLLARVGETG